DEVDEATQDRHDVSARPLELRIPAGRAHRHGIELCPPITEPLVQVVNEAELERPGVAAGAGDRGPTEPERPIQLPAGEGANVAPDVEGRAAAGAFALEEGELLPVRDRYEDVAACDSLQLLDRAFEHTRGQVLEDLAAEDQVEGGVAEGQPLGGCGH